VRKFKGCVAWPALVVSGCLYNPIIDEEIAEQCGILASDFQKIEAKLKGADNGQPILAGHCRFARTKGVTEISVFAGSR